MNGSSKTEGSSVIKGSTSVIPGLPPWLADNLRYILWGVLGLVIISAGIGGYMVYGSHQVEQGKVELGKIALEKDPKARLAKLDEFLQHAPEHLTAVALLEAISTAKQLKDNAKEVEYWQVLTKKADLPLLYIAQLGLASSLAKVDKKKEAIEALQNIENSADAGSFASIAIWDEAKFFEEMGDFSSAISNYDKLKSKPESLRMNYIAAFLAELGFLGSFIDFRSDQIQQKIVDSKPAS